MRSKWTQYPLINFNQHNEVTIIEAEEAKITEEEEVVTTNLYKTPIQIHPTLTKHLEEATFKPTEEEAMEEETNPEEEEVSKEAVLSQAQWEKLADIVTN